MKTSKYSATRNTFLVIDNRAGDFFLTEAERKCKSEGTDGILLLEDSSVGDFKMRIINSDGGEVEMCGNGLRAITHFAHFELNLPGNTYKIETMGGLYESSILDDSSIKVKMTEFYDWGKFDLDNGYYLNTGVPHGVFFVDNLDEVDVEQSGKDICFSEPFLGEINVNFVQVEDEGQAHIRTYERGVFGETLSCGTGATASAIALAKHLGWKERVSLNTRGGPLSVHFDDDFKNVFLSGKVEKIINE